MLHMTDMHIDLGYVAGNNRLCGTPLCCRFTDGPAPNASAAAGYWGNTDGNCDIPYRTAEQAMSFLESKDIDLVVWTGDNIGHNDWTQEMSTQFENTKILAKAFKKHLPNARIIGTPGNHECFPVNQCAFGGELFSWMNEQLAEAYEDLLSEASLITLREYGYYAEPIEEKNLIVVAYNSQVCANDDYYLLRDPTDPSGFIEWYKDILYDAESKGQIVYTIGHAPPQGCSPEWGARFGALIDRF